MLITREEKKAEAIARMKAWGIFPETIDQFRKDDLVSESLPPMGACFWLDEAAKARVKEFEETHNALVYHVIHSYTNFGELENYLYVSDHKDEWEYDLEDLQHGEQLCYVQNLSDPICSEFGTIGIALTPAAGLKRTW